MKKVIKILGIVALVLIGIAVIFAAVLFVKFGGMDTLKSLVSKQETTQSTTITAPQTTETTTTATTTEIPHSTTTTKAYQELTEPSTPDIELDKLSIIDLYPLSLSGGNEDMKHCQGITVDKKNEFVYYSYTSMLIKCNFAGEVVGSVRGIKGHLGDITFNEADGMIYCPYYTEGRTGFFVYIFNTKKITKKGMKPTSDVVRSVFIKDAYDDYLYKETIEKADGSTQNVKQKHACNGIDGASMGPDFSKKETGKEFLTFSYILDYSPSRKDNDYQVLLQYDVTDWWSKYGQDISKQTNTNSPQKKGKYFIYTGATKYGIQTIEYFDELNVWLCTAYKTRKEEFNEYTLFVIDGDFKPKSQNLKGMPKKEKGQVLTLYTDGHHDKKHEIWGWYCTYGTQGIAYMGDGLFYVCQPYKVWTGEQVAICYLNVWKSNKNGKDPFELAVDIKNDYKIKKAKHITTTAPPTTKPETTNNPLGSLNDAIMDFFGIKK